MTPAVPLGVSGYGLTRTNVTPPGELLPRFGIVSLPRWSSCAWIILRDVCPERRRPMTPAETEAAAISAALTEQIRRDVNAARRRLNLPTRTYTEQDTPT